MASRSSARIDEPMISWWIRLAYANPDVESGPRADVSEEEPAFIEREFVLPADESTTDEVGSAGLATDRKPAGFLHGLTWIVWHKQWPICRLPRQNGLVQLLPGCLNVLAGGEHEG